MAQSLDSDTILLNKFHQLTIDQQQEIINFMDFLLSKQESKKDAIPSVKSKPALAGTQPFEFLATPEESGIPEDEWEMEQ